MAWPTNKPDSNKFASDDNSIKESRPELNTMSQAVNDIVDYVDTAAEANGYILQYNSGTGKLEYVPNNAAIDINGNNGITVTQPSSGGHDIEFSGTYDAGNITYTFASSQLELLGSGSITPTIKSTSSGSEKGINILAGGSPTTGIYIPGPNDAIQIIPGGGSTKLVYLDGNLQLGPLNTDTALYSRGAGDLTIGTNSGVGGGKIIMTEGTNGNISIEPNGTGSIVCSDKTVTQAVLKDYAETVYTGGTTTGTITPDVANGNVQSITLSGNITLNALGNPATGHSMTLIVKQPGSGGPYTLSSTMKFAGGTKTLSTTANAIDVLSIFYDGTDYLASLSTNFS